MSEYVPSVDDLTRALSYWGRMTRDEARSAIAAHDREVVKEFLLRHHRPSVRIENPEDILPFLAAHDREVKAEALREAAVAMRAHKDPGHWNLRDERDPANASQSPDAWLEVRADRIERGR